MKKFISFLFVLFTFLGAGFMLFPEANMCQAMASGDSSTTLRMTESESSLSEYSSTTLCSAQNDIKETDTVPSRNYTVVIDPGHGGADVKLGHT